MPFFNSIFWAIIWNPFSLGRRVTSEEHGRFIAMRDEESAMFFSRMNLDLEIDLTMAWIIHRRDPPFAD